MNSPYREMVKVETEEPVQTKKTCGFTGHLPYNKPIQLPEHDCLLWHCPHCLGHVGKS